MKTCCFYIEPYAVRDLFAHVSKPQDIAKVKLKVLEFILTRTGSSSAVDKPCIIVEQELFQRVFLVNQDGSQIISFGLDVYFPIEYDLQSRAQKPIECFYMRGFDCKISARNISEALSLLNQYSDRDTNIYGYVVQDSEEYIEEISCVLLDKILLAESGYIRYDYDERGYKEGIHPLFHLDINYSCSVHYKFGLNGRLTEGDIINILNLKTNCAELMCKTEKVINKKGIKNMINKRILKGKHKNY